MTAILRRRDLGQALAEFAIVLPLFVLFLFGILDVGRAIYMYNGVSQAAREIARVTSVHPGAPLGSSAQATAMVATQRKLVPGISDLKFHCVDLMGATVPGDGIGGCAPGDVVKVEVHFLYEPLTPLVGLIGPFDIQSYSSNQVQ